MDLNSQPAVKECGNCGSTESLLRCSRCHTEHYCTAKCQRAHWPFHRQGCRRNEFADAIEDSDQKFALWMRSHGKQAILKDDEVDRIERAAGAASGTRTREEVIQSMYGRLDPKPVGATADLVPRAKGPSYSLDERQRMTARKEAEGIEDRKLTRADKVWNEIHMPDQLSTDCGSYKWRQNQSHVEIFVRLPTNVKPKQVRVGITSTQLDVSAEGTRLAGGTLKRAVVPGASLWQLVDGIVEITLLKANRKGRYAPGTTNADTYWDRPWMGCLEGDHMPTSWAPPVYYSSPFEDDTATNQLALEAADDEIRRERQKVQQQQRQSQLAVH